MNEDFERLFIGMTGQTALGIVWVAVSAKGLAAVEIGGEAGDFTLGLATRFGVELLPSEFETAEVVHQIEAYLRGERKSFTAPIAWEVLSPFQQKVLHAVYDIPYGETRSYGQIAAAIGSPGAARAVGRANATNPMSLVIPCHRLVGADGSLCGYGSGEGLKTKAWLLAMEKQHAGGALTEPGPRSALFPG